MQQGKTVIMRSISIAVTVMFLIVSIMAGAECVSAASRLKVSVTKRTIYVGQTTKLRANMNVKWSVSKRKIAKPAKVGKRAVKVKGLKAGTVYVTAKAGKKTKKIKITVKAKPPKKISLKTTDGLIGLGEYCTVSVKSVSPSDADRKVDFSSSDKSIAVVTDKGLVVGNNVGTVTITARSKADHSVKAKIKITVVPTKAGTITVNVDLSDEERYPAGKVARVWLPVPQNDEHQLISAVNYKAPGAKTAKLTKDSGGGKQLYIEWGTDAKPADRKATLSYHIYRRAAVREKNLGSKEKGKVDRTAFANELKETYWSGSLTSGIVKETADGIVKNAGATTVYAKAYAIYNWVCNNITRIDDKDVVFGDVVSILSKKRLAGSCMDVNSVFVSLCRAEGIPARNLFGMRFTPAYGPNCRAEFYLPGYGWVVADPALAIKQSWGHESEYIGTGAPKAATWKEIKMKYWASGEENWICNNMGRDITLTPKQSMKPGEPLDVLNADGTINLFMFPYGEFDDQYIPCRDAENFKYDYSFKEEDPRSCGC